MFTKRIAAVFILIALLAFSPAPPSRISLSMETKILKKGQVVTIKAEVYYLFDQGKMITRYLTPSEYLFISNNKGEASVYYPASNQVAMKQAMEYDTEKTMLYYFLADKLNDLGLKDLGFKLTDTRFEEGLIISTWEPATAFNDVYSKVELVHENDLPIYIAYFNVKGKLIQKIYYYNYEFHQDLALPHKVLEYQYLQDGDSIMNRIAYSNVKTGSDAQNEIFNFKIPANARIIK